MKKNTIAIVPAFNEERTIGIVIKNLLNYVNEVIVVSDCSSDNTLKISKKFKALVLKNKLNMGPDYSTEKGIKLALKLNYKYILTFDADDQHPYKKIPIFLSKLEKNEADIVIGQRKVFPRFAEYFYSFYAKSKIGVPDPVNGFKAIRSDVIKKIGYFDNIDSLTSQVLFNAYKIGYKIENVKINVKDRKDQPRIGGIFKSNFKILRSLIKIMLFNKI